MNSIIPYIQSNEEPELQELIVLRRAFHQFPELGFTEFWTTATICEYLGHLGYELIVGKALYDDTSQQKITLDDATRQQAYQQARVRLGHERWIEQMQDGFTGVVAHIKGAKDGPTCGFRFDIDGLYVQEATDAAHRPAREGFASVNGNMHACGHDGHLTIGLGLAKRIAAHIQELAGDYYLIFQPAEETTSLKTTGGKIFSHLECIERLDYFFATHLGIVNARRIICGLSFLSQKKFYVFFEGDSAHAAGCPEKGNNALLAACCAVNNLYTIPRHTDGKSRINAGQFVSANPTNIISAKARFEMELRADTNDILEYLVEHAQNIIKGAAAMHNVREKIEFKGEWINVKNSQFLVNALKHAALKSLIPEHAITGEQDVSVCEDAPFLMREVQQHGGQATYLCLGSLTYGGHHTPTFDFDEDLLWWGVNILWTFIQLIISSAFDSTEGSAHKGGSMT